MNKIEIKQGGTYIVKGKQFSIRTVYIKYFIEEMTEFTVLIKNMDSSPGVYLSNGKQRMSIVDFNTQYEVLEEILPATDRVLRKNEQADV